MFWNLTYFLIRINFLFLLIFFISSLKRWWCFLVFYIESCNFNYCCLTLFITIRIISIIIIQFMIFKITIIFFNLYFCMRAFILRRCFKITFWFTFLFEITEIIRFIRLFISIELMFEELIVLWLRMIIIIIITRATKCCFLHNNFE